nr:putative serine/threonine-protein kinase-like protein CCR3 [Quercus suber]
MEMTEEVDSPPLYTLPPLMDESEFNWLESWSSRSQSSRSSRTNSSTSSAKLSPSTSLSSPREVSPSPSMSTESQAKNAEDSVKKKSFYKSSPPPPPPPPPPMIPKASLMKLYSSSVNEEFSLEKDMRRSFTSVPKDLNGSRGEKLMSRVNSGVESMPRSKVDGLSMGKLVRATRAGEAVAGAWNVRDFGEDAMNGNLETSPKDAQPNFVEKSGRKTKGFDQTSFRTKKLSRESGPVISKPPDPTHDPTLGTKSAFAPFKNDQQHQRKSLKFIQRLYIAIDVAYALEYLHNHCQIPIVHCDLKLSNILLDEDMVAHVGDFGLVNFLFEASNNPSKSHTLSVGLKGSIGYIAPEYGIGGQVSTLGDIYSYVILLLEMFIGKRPIDEMFKDGLSIHKFTAMAFPEHVIDIVDPSIFLEENEEDANGDIEEIQIIEEDPKECLILMF